MSILYRDHRGSLDESMATVQEIKDWGQLRMHLKKCWEGWGYEIAEIKINYCCFDPRINWETYYVLMRFRDQKDFVVAGMSNGCELPEIFIELKTCLN